MKIINIKLLIVLTIFSLAFVQCSEDYLDTEPTEEISAKQITEASKITSLDGNIAGLYSTMFKTGTGGTNLSHWDFGQKGYDIFSDMLCGDMILAGTNYGWYENVVRYQVTTDYTSTECYGVWRYYYRIIRGANAVIDALGGSSAELTKSTDKYNMGQAQAMRAYAYLYLANFFSNEYDPSAEILPLYTNTTEPNLAKSSTADVYALIVSDLTQAIEYLDGFSRTGKQAINKYVAEGLLSYAYATMGDYTKVADLTKDVIDNGGFTLMSAEEVVGGFNDVSTAGWMWGVDLTNDIGLDLVSWWGQCDIFTYSYAAIGDAKVCNDYLYESIPSYDIRKTQFDTAFGGFNMAPFNKFYTPEREVFTQRTVTTDYVYMRIAEMYLLRAEALANTGDEAGAKDILLTLENARFNSNSANNLTYEELVSNVDNLGLVDYAEAASKAKDKHDAAYNAVSSWHYAQWYLANMQGQAFLVNLQNYSDYLSDEAYESAVNFENEAEKLRAPVDQAIDNVINSNLKSQIATRINALSGQALKDEIYLQTRMELWGEGKSYLAMKRNKATIKRGANDVVKPDETYQYNADELTFKIPQSEILNNPQISE